MRFILFILLLLHNIAFAQNETFDVLLSKGKTAFKEEDYTSAIASLKKATTLNPENAEAHYFLGYAYSRLNARDGKSMINMNLQLNVQSSAEFEQVIQLTPKYTGELVVLDPYSKLTAEWGSMAMCYWNNNKIDSAVWAFNEGRRSGGFGKFYLSINRSILSQCSKNSILLCSGDNLTIPLWYLQFVEGFRKDVTVINVDLLNTTWYPQLLRTKSHVAFEESQSVIDTIETVPLDSDSLVWVKNKYAYKDFNWTLKKTETKNYLLRGDRILLSILKANEFESDVYMTVGFGEENRLGLQHALLSMILLDLVNVNAIKPYDFNKYKVELIKVLELTKNINPNSTDEMDFVNTIRYDLLLHLEEQHGLQHKVEVKQLLKLLDSYIPEKKFPYSSKETKNYVNHIRKQY
jgi:tetratricopeptide (TPR) repeat protein